MTCTPRTKRFSGKRRSMRSTDIFMPVASDAIAVACFRIKFCTGGTYSNIINITNRTIGVSNTQSAPFNHFLLIRTSIDSQCLNRYKVNKFQRHLVDAEDKKAIYSTIRHFIPRGSLLMFNARLKITSLSHVPTNESQTVSYRTYG